MAGAGTLKARPIPGRPCRLTDTNSRDLDEFLAKGAVEQGWPNNLWTAARVAQVIRTRFGVTYHPGYVRWLRKRRLNGTCQRPAHHHQDRNDTAIPSWAQEAFPPILKAAQARGAYLAFVDEAGFLLEPTVRRTYAPRGKTPVHRIGNPPARISAIGVITLSPSLDTIGLRYGPLGDNLTFQGPTVVQFLRPLRTEISAPLPIVWDQIALPDCEEVEEYLASTREVMAEPFPASAPERNPADGSWRYIKYGRLANYTPPDRGILRHKVTEEFERLKGRAERLRSFVRFTKLPIDL
jgi:transposase